MLKKVDLAEKLALIDEHWSPKAVGAVNDFHVKLVKLKGEFVWHAHEQEDRDQTDQEVEGQAGGHEEALVP